MIVLSEGNHKSLQVTFILISMQQAGQRRNQSSLERLSVPGKVMPPVQHLWELFVSREVGNRRSQALGRSLLSVCFTLLQNAPCPRCFKTSGILNNKKRKKTRKSAARQMLKPFGIDLGSLRVLPRSCPATLGSWGCALKVSRASMRLKPALEASRSHLFAAMGFWLDSHVASACKRRAAPGRYTPAPCAQGSVGCAATSPCWSVA